MSLISTAIQFAEIIKEMLLREAVVAVTDKKVFLHVINGEKYANLIRKGGNIPPNSGTERCIASKKMVKTLMPKEVLGIPYMVVAVPLIEGDESVGAMTVVYPVTQEEEMREMSLGLSSSMTQILGATDHMNEVMKQLAATSLVMKDFTERAVSETHKTKEIIDFINRMAGQTKILGLNANIEAARAGEAGRGFSIVAKEIQSMADHSSKSANQISQILGNIEQLTANLQKQISELAATSDASQQSVQSIHDSVASLQNISESLERVVKDTEASLRS
ncbi:MAG: methyl-accepting chemotaxis protein [Clostridia bacterium]